MNQPSNSNEQDKNSSTNAPLIGFEGEFYYSPQEWMGFQGWYPPPMPVEIVPMVVPYGLYRHF